MATDIGSYRLEKILGNLDTMMSLPTTNFPKGIDPLEVQKFENEKEREGIQKQPYRTSQLIFPSPKIKPDLVNTKINAIRKPNFKVVEQRNILQNLSPNHALVNKQNYNNPRPLYSDQNVQEAIYVQTGVNFAQPTNYRPPASPSSLSQMQPVHLTPDRLPEFKPQNSPTFRAILEEEGPGTLHQARESRQATGGRMHRGHPHATAPGGHQINSVGQPNDRIAQSGSFRRLMYHVMADEY